LAVERPEMKVLVRLLIFFLVIGLMIHLYAGQNRSAPIKPAIELGRSPIGQTVGFADKHKRPDLTAIFTNGNYQQWIDRFGTVSRSAFDASGNRIGTQVGQVGGPNGIVVEMTYLVPDAEHPLGQAFDGAGNPTPLHTGPDQPTDRTGQGPLVS
jgi:hypothetical protein